jgi:protein gp37
MSDRSLVQWTGATWNPWQGCRKKSDGCKFCYMFRDKERYGQDPKHVHRSSRATFDAPLKWQREAERGDRVGHDRFVFTCSWSDWFIEEADGPWRDDAWAIVKACPSLTFQILTKRPERMAGNFPSDWGSGYPNAWGGVSVENQAMADERIPILLGEPWSLRYLSVEPLLAAVNLGLWRVAIPKHREHWPAEKVDNFWCIAGGESGNTTGKYRARPCDLAWIRSVVEQCRAAGVPCFVKQLGSKPLYHGSVDGEAVPLDLKDHHGGNIDEWPCDLRMREMPTPRTTAPAGRLF